MTISCDVCMSVSQTQKLLADDITLKTTLAHKNSDV